MDPEALARKEFALCKYGTVLHIVNVKPSVHRTMMGTNVEALLVDVVGLRFPLISCPRPSLPPSMHACMHVYGMLICTQNKMVSSACQDACKTCSIYI